MTPRAPLPPIVFDVREHFGDWTINLDELRERATHVQREGGAPGSLDDEGLDYRVINGSEIFAAYGQRDDPLGDLWAAYHHPALAEQIRRATGRDVLSRLDMASVRSAINVNILEPGGKGYEWHRDSVAYTLLLFVTEHPGTQGSLVVQHPATGTVMIPPVIGQAVFFDGSVLPHRVLPTQGEPRVSVPMVFIDPDEHREARPPGLDKSLYG